jgi:type I restriction enzyme, S subunit
MNTGVREKEGVDRKLPDGWKWVKLKEICERIDYGFTASADFSITEPRFLRITDIQNGQVNWAKVPGCKISFGEEEANKLVDGDIVFARTGGTTGKSFLIKQPPRSVFASYLIRLRLHNDISAEYIYAFLQSNSYWQQIRQSARGGAQPNVNAQLLGSIILPLPPLAEQTRIAAILNEQMEAVEKARKATEAQLEAAKALPAAYLRAVFNSPEAQNWERKTIGEISLKVQNGIYKTSDNYGNGHPFLRMYNISNTSWDLTLEPLAQIVVDDEEIKTYGLKVGDILISRVNSYELVGKCAYVGEDVESFVFENMLIRVSLINSVNSLFVAQQMNDQSVRKQIQGVAKRAIGQASINSNDIRGLKLILPSLSIQEQIAKDLSNRVEELNKLCLSLKSQLEAINQLPAAILHKAFNGEL